MAHPHRVNGFTLIELIMVLVVLGALAVFVMPRLNTSGYDALSFQQELKTAIRYAHKTSLAAECEVQVVLTANSYALFYPDNTCNPADGFGTFPVNHPVQSGTYTGTAPAGISIAGFGNFFFSASGAPSNWGTITLNPDGRQIVVNRLTGFIQ